MKNTDIEKELLHELCARVKSCVNDCEYEAGTALVLESMSVYPHAAQPHNLMGILMEKKGELSFAMNHYRAANALDQSYLPSRFNMERLGGLKNHSACIFDDEDCPIKEDKNRYKIEYDENGIGHLVRGERL